MNDSPLRAALRKLLAQGEQAADNNMRKQFSPQQAPNPAESCPE